MGARIVIGSRNAKKAKEIQGLLADLPLEVVSLEDFPEAPEIKEDGATFRENAVKKACALAEATKEWVMADDSGLEVNVLGGRPGVRSARYAGEEQDDWRNICKLLKELRGVEDRSARFRCAIALARPEGLAFSVEGMCVGKIAAEPKGNYGFGYDPVFVPAGFDRTFAELGREVKDRISHRGKALRAFRKRLGDLMERCGGERIHEEE